MEKYPFELIIEAIDEYLMEKKTLSEYRLQKFKDKHDFDKKTNTIKIDGTKYVFDYKNKGKKHGTPIHASTGGTRITMNKASFNQKHPKTHEAIADHEHGHYDYTQSANNIPFDILDDMNNDIQKLADKHKLPNTSKDSRGNAVPFHGRKTEEYLADQASKTLIGTKNTINALNDSKRNIRKQMKLKGNDHGSLHASDREIDARKEAIKKDIAGKHRLRYYKNT